MGTTCLQAELHHVVEAGLQAVERITGADILLYNDCLYAHFAAGFDNGGPVQIALADFGKVLADLLDGIGSADNL